MDEFEERSALDMEVRQNISCKMVHRGDFDSLIRGGSETTRSSWKLSQADLPNSEKLVSRSGQLGNLSPVPDINIDEKTVR